MAARSELLALLNGRRIGRVPAFSGLIHITSAGLDSLGLRWSEIHTDARKLAAAAATSHRLFGWESAAVPSDLCVEASVLGAEVDFRADVDEPMWPVPAQPLAAHAQEFHPRWPTDPARHSRVATVRQALQLLKDEIGAEAAIGAWVPGPLTLAMQVIELDNLYIDLRARPGEVARVLDALTELLIAVARSYRAAGADFLTVHEMGGSPGVIGPAAFRALVLPRLQRLFAALPAPRVLSVCGDTNRAMSLLADAGAEAVSVDQTNRLAETRTQLGGRVLLFGNIDPVKTLAEGEPAAVQAAARRAREAGVDAIWPGCDLPPSVLAENMRVFARPWQD